MYASIYIIYIYIYNTFIYQTIHGSCKGVNVGMNFRHKWYEMVFKKALAFHGELFWHLLRGFIWYLPSRMLFSLWAARFNPESRTTSVRLAPITRTVSWSLGVPPLGDRCAAHSLQLSISRVASRGASLRSIRVAGGWRGRRSPPPRLLPPPETQDQKTDGHRGSVRVTVPRSRTKRTRSHAIDDTVV